MNALEFLGLTHPESLIGVIVFFIMLYGISRLPKKKYSFAARVMMGTGVGTVYGLIFWGLSRSGSGLAGDLNNWHWADESTADEVREAEEAYRAELDYLARRVTRFDVAMFPVDARLGSDYMRGARQFVERFEVGVFVPMHFYPAVAKAEAFAPIARQHGSKFALLSHTGDSIEL